MFKQIRKAGEEFTVNTLTNWVSKFSAAKNAPAEDRQAAAGVAGLAAGGLLQSVGMIGTAFAVVAAVVNPVGLATLGTLVVASAFGATAIFGKGMIDGGDRSTGLVSLSKGLKSELWSDVRQSLKAWSGAKLGPVFSRASKPADKTQLAVQPVVMPQQTPQNKL